MKNLEKGNKKNITNRKIREFQKKKKKIENKMKKNRKKIERKKKKKQNWKILKKTKQKNIENEIENYSTKEEREKN